MSRTLAWGCWVAVPLLALIAVPLADVLGIGSTRAGAGPAVPFLLAALVTGAAIRAAIRSDERRRFSDWPG